MIQIINKKFFFMGSECNEIGVIYEQNHPFDILIKYGEYSKIEELFLSDKYSKLSKILSTTNSQLKLIRVSEKTKEMVDQLNKCIEISACKHLTKLDDMIQKTHNV